MYINTSLHSSYVLSTRLAFQSAAGSYWEILFTCFHPNVLWNWLCSVHMFQVCSWVNASKDSYMDCYGVKWDSVQSMHDNQWTRCSTQTVSQARRIFWPISGLIHVRMNTQVTTIHMLITEQMPGSSTIDQLWRECLSHEYYYLPFWWSKLSVVRSVKQWAGTRRFWEGFGRFIRV